MYLFCMSIDCVSPPVIFYSGHIYSICVLNPAGLSFGVIDLWYC